MFCVGISEFEKSQRSQECPKSAVFSCPNEGVCSKTMMLGFVFCFTSTSLSSPFLNVNTSLNTNILQTVPLIKIKEV